MSFSHFYHLNKYCFIFPKTATTGLASRVEKRNVSLRQWSVYTFESFFINYRFFILSPRVFYPTQIALNQVEWFSGSLDFGRWKKRSYSLFRTDKYLMNELYRHMIVPILDILPPRLVPSYISPLLFLVIMNINKFLRFIHWKVCLFNFTTILSPKITTIHHEVNENLLV